MARKTVKTLAQKMAVSGKEPAKDVLDDTDLSDDPIISAIQSLREVIDDLQANDIEDNSTNTAKTGITTSQANAITANTAKTGISTSQASAITANTAKTGISDSQASAITANTAKGDTKKDLAPGSEGGTLIASVAESRGVYTLTFTFKTSDGRTTKKADITMS